MAPVGYARATMPEVTRAAGLSQGLLHDHFRDRRSRRAGSRIAFAAIP
ncbi:MAG: TetR family transcriptional regulator [Deltaproteobacteria bacterium]|nr:TetR family transcriptional regulator [Deltaproteobacteria bacterium]